MTARGEVSQKRPCVRIGMNAMEQAHVGRTEGKIGARTLSNAANQRRSSCSYLGVWVSDFFIGKVLTLFWKESIMTTVAAALAYV